MKTILKVSVLAVVTSASAVALAQEQGRVLASTPVISQVAVPRQVCSQQQVAVEQPKSGAGGMMGAIAGGAIGNSVGGGSGRALATMIGVIGGAMAGDRIEGPAPVHMQTVQNCTTQTFYENRTTGYNVTYEYAGRQYQVQMPSDPGPFIPLQVAPMSGMQQMSAPSYNTQPVHYPAQQAVVVQQQPVVVQQAPVVAAPQVVVAPAPVVYAPAPRYQYAAPAVTFGIGLGLGHIVGGYHYGHYRRHWH